MADALYYQDDMLFIKSLSEGDAVPLSNAFTAQNTPKSAQIFHRYAKERDAGRRIAITALYGGIYAGYATVMLNVISGLFTGTDIPQIDDLHVLSAFQRRGIGGRLLEVAERLAAEHADVVGIGVGLHGGQSPARRMVVKRGYIPASSGVWYRGKLLSRNDPCRNDDELILYFTKQL